MNTELSKEEIETLGQIVESSQRTCYHEAGHAVMFYIKKIPFDYVSMEANEIETTGVQPFLNVHKPLLVCWSEGFNIEDPKNAKLVTYTESLLMTCLAGPIAEMLYIGEENLSPQTSILDLMIRYGGRQDFMNGDKTANFAYPRLGDDYDKWLNWLACRVERIFKQSLYWSMVVDVAFNLGDFDSLACKEVTQICRSVEKEYKKKSLKEVKE